MPEAMAKSWGKLFDVVKNYDIGLFVGAGLSIANGMPSWGKLTEDLSGYPPSDSISPVSQLGIAYDEARRNSHTRNNWIERVRECLYADFYQQLEEQGCSLSELEERRRPNNGMRQYCDAANPPLAEIVRMCAIRGEDEVPRIVSVLTTNYDSLIQIYDRAIHGSPRQLRTIERATKSSDGMKTSLYHLHGYLTPHPNTNPKKEAADRLVLTELDYVRRNDDPYHWAATILHWALRECPVVFLGCSMTDDLVRRALFRTRKQRIKDCKAEKSESRLNRHKKAKHFAVCRWIRDEQTRKMLKKSYKLMDINPLWVETFSNDEFSERLATLSDELSQ